MCFSLNWLEQLLIWLVVVCAIVALLRLVVGFILPRIGLAGEFVSIIVRVIQIVIWAVVLIAVIIFVFDLIYCLVPRLPRL